MFLQHDLLKGDKPTQEDTKTHTTSLRKITFEA